MTKPKYWNTMNQAQRETCKRLWTRHFDDHARAWATEGAYPERYLTFRRRFRFVHEGMSGYFFGQMPGGYYLGIEHDGYAHT